MVYRETEDEDWHKVHDGEKRTDTQPTSAEGSHGSLVRLGSDAWSIYLPDFFQQQIRRHSDNGQFIPVRCGRRFYFMYHVPSFRSHHQFMLLFGDAVYYWLSRDHVSLSKKCAIGWRSSCVFHGASNISLITLRELRRGPWLAGREFVRSFQICPHGP